MDKKCNWLIVRLADGDTAKLNYISKVAKIKKSELVRKWIDETTIDHKQGKFETICGSDNNFDNLKK